MDYYRILAYCSEDEACRLAERVLADQPASEVKLISGPRQGLVMVRVRETVADSLFHAGELLVTEVRLELAGQFGFGMVIGNHPRHAMAVAVVDAALRSDSPSGPFLHQELLILEKQLEQAQRHQQALSALTKVEFERI